MEGRLQHQAERVWAIVLEVKTGAVLAMATIPGYDPSHFNSSPSETYRNCAIAQVYDPGSVMKTITACAALNERIVGRTRSCPPTETTNATSGCPPTRTRWTTS